jgi:hypothetical protein
MSVDRASGGAVGARPCESPARARVTVSVPFVIGAKVPVDEAMRSAVFDQISGITRTFALWHEMAGTGLPC